MRLIHFTKRATLDRRAPISQSSDRKPIGMWVSDEDDEQLWSSWCADEDYCDLSTRNAFSITLDMDRILLLSSEEDILAFTEEFKDPESDANRRYTSTYALAWWRVAELHDGIVITPYQWNLRYDVDWYYSWDVASGCIWNMDAVETIELIRIGVDA